MGTDKPDELVSKAENLHQDSNKEVLFARLLKRQYPMSQDEPSMQPDKPQDSVQDYHARMDKWLEDHSNEW